MAYAASPDQPAANGTTGMAADVKMLARWASLGACAGGLSGLLIGGVGGRLAMLLLRFTTDTPIKGIESDDGFTMGRFDVSSTIGLLALCAILGSIGGLIVVFATPFFSRRSALIGWPIAAGAIVGATIIKADGVDFTLLGPKQLAVAMFVAIPATGAFAIVWLVYRWEPWWGKDWRRTTAAAIGGVPALLFFPLGILAVAVCVAWFLAIRVEGVRRLNGWVPVRALAAGVFALLTGLGLFSLGNDIAEIL